VLHFAPWVPIVPISARSGTGLPLLMQTAWTAAEEFRHRVSTGELNRFFEQVLDRHPPPTSGGKAPRLYYITQAQSAPPVFVAMSNAPKAIRESYQRFLVNQIREHFGFRSVPIRVFYKQKGRREP
jgi:GTPase